MKATDKKIASYLAAAQELSTRIETILTMVPEDYEKRSLLNAALESRKRSIPYTAAEAMAIRWNEVAQTLCDFLPNPQEVEWARNIAVYFAKPV